MNEDVKQLLREEFIKTINENEDSFEDTNAGFRKFLKRKGAPLFNYKKGGKVAKEERSKAEEPLSNYESYSENELLSSLDAKMPNLQIVDDELVTMPKFKPLDVLPPNAMPVMPSLEQLINALYMEPIGIKDGGYISKGKKVNTDLTTTIPPISGPNPQGIRSLFKQRKRYADGGNAAANTVNGIPIDEWLKNNFQYEKVPSTDSSGNQTFDNYGNPNYTIAVRKDYLGDNPMFDWNTGKPTTTTVTTPTTTTEIPTVDPFSGQQVSAQDQAAFTQPQQNIFPQQDVLANIQPDVVQTYEGQSTPYDFISSQLQNIFNNPAVKGYSNFITGSGNPFQDINQFTTSQQNVINQAIQNAMNQGRTNITYADYPKTGITQLMNDGFTPMEYLKTLGSSMFGNPVDQIKTTLGQFSYDPESNRISDRYDFQKQLGNNLGTPYDINMNLKNSPIQRTINVGSPDINTQALGASVGNLDYSTINSLRNNSDALNTITGQTANMADGGLTRTIPPVRGPIPQGVETLFKKRYN